MTDPMLLEALADAYWRDGFAVLPGAVGSDRVAEARRACEQVLGQLAEEVAAGSGAFVERGFARRTVAGGRAIDRIDPVADLDPRLEALVTDPIVLEPVEALIGSPAVLLKSKLVRKGAGVDGYGAHQDQAYYRYVGVDAARCVSVLVPLDPFAAVAGPLEVATGTHGELVPCVEGTEDPAPEQLVGMTWTVPRQDPGDLGFLHPLTLHRSSPNRSRQDRRILFLTYVAGPGSETMAERLAALFRDRFRAVIGEGGSGELSAPAPDARRGARSPR